MKRQLELMKEAVKLAEENPNYEIHFAVSNEELSEGAWTDHEIESVNIEWLCRISDVIYLGKKEIEEEYEDILGKKVEVENMINSRKVILVRTTPR